ncbi:hypothetical protein BC629DRAFT_1439996 [Irpex lacteus]|nr:hypothetical protein BC629DRAFT_1439996 [Irpex lacteus]
MPFYPSTPFTSLHNQAGLVSLDDARANHSIVYRSVDIAHPDTEPIPRLSSVPTVQGISTLKSSIPLISLSAAQAKKEIKYRREGFEMQETRRRIVKLGYF